jgi:hypothetical protein
MDLVKIIRKLHEERAKLDKIIASLEKLQRSASEGTQNPKPRRGRKFMDAKGRQEVSERMKNYWAARKQKESGPSTDA